MLATWSIRHVVIIIERNSLLARYGASGSGLPEAAPARLREGFVLALGQELHTQGAPAHRLEPELERLSRALGLEGQFLITPTSMLAAFGPPEDQRTHLIRVDQGDEDLGKLLELDEIARDVERGLDTPTGGVRRLREVAQRGPRYGLGGVLAGFVIASAGAARFFGGGAVEVILAGLNGLLLALALERFGSRGQGWLQMVCAFVMALAGSLLSATVLPHAHSIVLIAGLIVLVPGWTLTVGLLELARNHLSSGTSRLAKAASMFLMLGLGVGLARKVTELTTGDVDSIVHYPMSAWTEWVALAFAPLGFLLLFGVRWKEAHWVMVGGIGGYLISRFTAVPLGPEAASFLGALGVGLWSNWFARRKYRPSLVPLLPALILLVPGSLGFEGVRLFLSDDAVTGIDVLFRMLLIGVSLASGVVLAHALLPARRGV